MAEVITAHVTAPPPDSSPQAGIASSGSDNGADHPFPDLLRSHRKRAGLTQRALADLSTISPRAIRDLEAGRANARTQTIYLLADGLRLQGLMRELFIHAGLSGRHGSPCDADFGPGVPKPVNALLGRDTEVRALADALESGRRRMISISGLPGVGKTRVAAEIAARLSSRRGWPVLWLDTDMGARAGHGTAFGPLLRLLRSLIESPTDDMSRVCQLVGRHEALVVLDGVADVTVPVGVTDLLMYCPGVRVISTSRAPWHVPGVQATVISPLTTPGPERDAGASLDALAGVPSVRLLVDRLAEVRPGFTLTPANAVAAAELCRRLDGLPLALEVVALRLRVLTLQQLAEVPVLDLLDLPVPAPSRAASQTIGGLISSCYERLDAAHRAILRRLVRFERAWTVADAARVLRRPLDEVVDDLSVLIGHGLVRASHGGPATDLHIPNLLRTILTHSATRPHVRQYPHSWGCVSDPAERTLDLSLIHPTKRGGGMAYNSAEALREAGLIGGTMTPELEEFYASLTKEEVDVLISTKNRLNAILPDVVAHSERWTAPEATQQGFDAAMLCACGAWSGSGGK